MKAKAAEMALKGNVPYYGAIKAGMKRAAAGQQASSGSRKKKRVRLTDISRGTGKAILLDGVAVNRAIKKLYDYEETGLSPHEIFILIERERNLTKRLEKMMDWEE